MPLLEGFRSDLRTYIPNFEANHLPGKYLSVTAPDGVKLTGYLTYSSQDSVKGTVIMLHGIRSKKEHFIELSAQLSERGFHSVALDLRAHGSSGGEHCTFGVKEKADVSALIDLLTTEENITDNIGVWGQSLGGAIGLQAAGQDRRIKFAVIESTFADFRIIVHDYFCYHLGFNIPFLTDYLIQRAGKIADFDPEEAKPSRYCQSINQPVLLVHGDVDRRISIEYARQNFAQIPAGNKEFVQIRSAHHLNVWEVGGEPYFAKVMNFLEESCAE